MSVQPSEQIANNRRTRWSGILVGVGLMALIDEIIFHQLLQWHHFYDKSTTVIGIVSDGLLNAFGLFSIVLGLFMLAGLHNNHFSFKPLWTAFFFIGLGSFQLLDGIINHKLLRVHQIRYNVNILPYDIAWHASALLLIIIGFILYSRTKKQAKVNNHA